MSRRRGPLSLLSLASLLLLGGCVPDAGRPDLPARAFLRVLQAEDIRPAGGPALEILLDATRSLEPSLRAVGVRALGRLERPERVVDILPLLDDDDATVRAEAADALAQSVHRAEGGTALEPLLAASVREADPFVLGVIARALGRLSLTDEGRRTVDRALVALSVPEGGGPVAVAQRLGVALGMESFARRGPVSVEMADRLRDLTRLRAPENAATGQQARVRAVATAALGASRHMTAADVDRAFQDPSAAVRQTAAARLSTLDPVEAHTLIERALRDESAQVRLEGIRSVARAPLESDCQPLIRGFADPDPHVRLAALDALGRPCADRGAQVTLLREAADDAGASTNRDWHAAAHATVALAALDAEVAAPFLDRLLRHPSPFARAYAARAALHGEDGAALRRLARDLAPNVRTAAVQALATLQGRVADGTLLATLRDANDPELVLTLARLLAGTELRPEATEVALDALDRLSEARMQTLRDPRLALLDLVEVTAGEGAQSRVEPYLRDFDEAVARRAAEVLHAWTGDPYLGAPRPVERLPLPTVEELREMERATVTLRMARGGTIEIRLLPLQAPTNAYRLYRLARGGGLDGLTFHRVVPNFVIQGGSPGANEYAGHGSYTRDEVGTVVQWAGTVGLSTRGRDTGDGQIYINLVDNLRLNHDYTVLGVVTAGREVVHGVLEGDVIASASVRAH
jgi:cyclophilin family peptidyl-prolyl cis-trans isomerase/HEAT repeat protein